MDPFARLPGSHNLAFIEKLWADFQRDPSSVPAVWRQRLADLSDGDSRIARLATPFHPSGIVAPDSESGSSASPSSAASVQTPVARTGPISPPARTQDTDAASSPPQARPTVEAPPSRPATESASERRPAPPADSGETGRLAAAAVRLVQAFREHGHLAADVNPLLPPHPPPEPLRWESHGLRPEDLDASFPPELSPWGGEATFRETIARLRASWCGPIGVQYGHLGDPAMRKWIEARIEGPTGREPLGREQDLRILRKLTEGSLFEQFIRRKYVGAKSFSLEGSESLLVLLDRAVESAGESGIAEIVMGMPHRGRLNVLANIVGKPPRDIFREFEDASPELYTGRGDVKYHLGHSSDLSTASGKSVHVSLCFNPSHLEFVDPVVLGRLRAKQDRTGDGERRRGLAIVVHGDAAFAGEGIVQETLNLARLPGFEVGGALHVVLDNQVGFTTSPAEGRSTRYPSDVARMMPIPVLHVNGELPDAVVRAVDIALAFRAQFRSDVLIELIAYRRHGHNESDDPSFTQPILYRALAARRPVRDLWLAHLLEKGGIDASAAESMARERREFLESELAAARDRPPSVLSPAPRGVWEGFRGGPEREADEVATRVDRRQLVAILRSLIRLPEGFHPHPRIAQMLGARGEMAAERKPLDWAAAEALALGSLSAEGRRIRLCGQDSARGTFSHRHAVLHDVETGATRVPLRELFDGQGEIEIVNSPLSEAGVLGFEYGYSLDHPECLAIWEAQFGDFANAAQVIIDQFLSSAEAKWHRLSGLVLLLPHGAEGAGPEHSSARPERFLQLASDDNIQVVSPTTPAQFFHCLRRQALRRWRKPLVVLSPKSLLRHPAAVSPLEEFATGAFRRVLPDPRARKSADRILLCCGKVWYDLDQARDEAGLERVAILRLEQLHPFPWEHLRAALAAYRDGTPALWVQEEPENQGAWRYVSAMTGNELFGRFPLHVVSRPASPSPATGSAASHRQEQRRLVERALGISHVPADDAPRTAAPTEGRTDHAEPTAHSRDR